MAQQRLRDFQSPLGSFLHNLINLGVHLPGRFCGFDTLLQTGQLQFSLTHAASGVNTSDQSGNPYGPLGVMMSNQGEILMEDAPITGLAIESNAGNPLIRMDIVVLNHQYIQLANPATANYSVVKGPLNQTTNPQLSPFQTPVGFLIIPAGATLISQCTYTKAPNPDSGDSVDAKLAYPNVYQKTNANAADFGPFIAPTSIDNAVNNLWDLSVNGNAFSINPPNAVSIDGLRLPGINNQQGMEITLVINQFVTLRSGMPLSQAALNAGYGVVQFSSRLTTAIQAVNGASINALTPPPGNSLWFVTLIKWGLNWFVKSIDGQQFSTGTFIKGMTVEVNMAIDDIINNWAPDGLGIGLWNGWQLCNGLRGTQDKRGRTSFGATDIPAAGQNPVNPDYFPTGFAIMSLGFTGGFAKVAIPRRSLPPEGLNILESNGQPYVYDIGGSNANSLKGDSDNAQGNFVKTENLGQGIPMDTIPPYIYTMWATKL